MKEGHRTEEGTAGNFTQACAISWQELWRVAERTGAGDWSTIRSKASLVATRLQAPEEECVPLISSVTPYTFTDASLNDLQVLDSYLQK